MAENCNRFYSWPVMSEEAVSAAVKRLATALETRVPCAPVRDLMGVLSGLVALHFYDDPRVMDHLGYFIEDHIRQVNARPSVPAAETVRIGGAGR